MDLRKLRYFVAVAETGSISKAAAVLGLAQPALTQSLSRFEKEIGLRVLIRSRTGVQLTEGGQLLLDEGKELLARADMLSRTAARHANGEAGLVRVGYVSTALHVLPRGIVGFQRAFPQSRVKMQELATLEQIQALKTGDIDMGICYLPPTPPSWLQCSVLSEHPLRAVLPAASPAARAASIGLSDLAEMGLVLFPPNKGVPSQAEIVDAFRRSGAEPRVVHEANPSVAVMACVAAGLGVGVLPDCVSFIGIQGIVLREIRKPHELPLIRLALIRRKHPRRKLVERLWHALKEQMGQAAA